jgi:hypothetical protein
MNKDKIIVISVLSFLLVVCIIILILGLTGVLVPSSVAVTPQCLLSPFYVFEYLAVPVNGITDSNVFAAFNDTQIIQFTLQDNKYFVPGARTDLICSKLRSYTTEIGALVQPDAGYQINFIISGTEISFDEPILDFYFLSNTTIVYITSTELHSATLINGTWVSTLIYTDENILTLSTNGSVIAIGTDKHFVEFYYDLITFTKTNETEIATNVIYVSPNSHIYISSTDKSYLYINGLPVLSINDTIVQFAEIGTNFVIGLSATNNSLTTYYLNNYQYASEWSKIETSSSAFYFIDEKLALMDDQQNLVLYTYHCL